MIVPNSFNWAPKGYYRVRCSQCVGQTINLGKVCSRCLNREYPPHLVVWTGERWASRQESKHGEEVRAS